MALLTNSFEGGTSGTTISSANSGGVSGNAFDTVSIGASAVLAFDNAHAAHGVLALQCSTPAVAATSFAYWGASLGAGHAQVWFRAYLYFTANPSALHRVVTFWNTTSATTLCGSVVVNTGGTLAFLSSTGATIVSTVATIPLNQWFRIEGFITGSATVGQAELKLFKTADSATADETQTSAATQNTAGTIGTAGFGSSSSTASVGPFWMDDAGASTTGYLGPVAGNTPQALVVPSAAVMQAANW